MAPQYSSTLFIKTYSILFVNVNFNPGLFAQYCQLEQRKSNLQLLLSRMHNFQMESVMSRPLDAPLPDGFRILKQEEVDR